MRDKDLRALPDRPSPRVLLIGLEGLNLTDACGEHLCAMPGVRALMERGARVALAVPPTRAWRSVWTTVATGVAADLHGIVNDVVLRPDGLGTRAPWAEDRRALTLMDVAAAAGLCAASVNWPATHEIDAVAGGACTVSDLYPIALAAHASDWPLHEGVVSPSGLREAMRALRVTGRDIESAQVLALAPALRSAGHGDDAPARVAVALARDCTAHNAATWIAEHEQPDLLAVRYTLAHGMHALTDGYVRAGAPCAAFIDLVIARLMTLMGEGVNVVLVAIEPTHTTAVVTAAGPDVRANPASAAQPSGVGTTLDVAPAALALLGLSPPVPCDGLAPAWACGPAPMRPVPLRSRLVERESAVGELAGLRSMAAELDQQGYRSVHALVRPSVVAALHAHADELGRLAEFFTGWNVAVAYRAWAAQRALLQGLGNATFRV